MTEPTQINEQTETIRKALLHCRESFYAAAFLSFFINFLIYAPMFYTMQVFDRVMASSSMSTLALLTILLVFLLALMGGLEWIRAEILLIAGNRMDHLLNTRVFDAMFNGALSNAGRIATSQPMNDLLELRQFLVGHGLFAFFDAPWLPLSVILMFWFHWSYGLLMIVSAVILIGLNCSTEFATRDLLTQAEEESMESSQHIQRNLRNIDAIDAMGMLSSLRQRWLIKHQSTLALMVRVSQRTSTITGLTKFYRALMQALILGLGVYLVINKEITSGGMMAGSMLIGRALAPLEMLIGSWKGFVMARDAYERLEKLLKEVPLTEPPMLLPPPKGQIKMENVTIFPAGSKKPILYDVSLQIEAGQHVAVIGPSAAGKSTLVRAMLGLLKPSSGSVRLDGAEINQWDRAVLGAYIGYLPQDVELLEGSISENIARFGEIDPEQVVTAAQLTGIHEMVLRMQEGYDTVIQGQSAFLSAGQRQRLGLARALYGFPRLIVLDEPNSNLDQDGEAALAAALAGLRSRGSTVVLVTHRPSILGQVDSIILLREGQLVVHGPRDDVLQAMQRAALASMEAANQNAQAQAVNKV